MELIGCLLAGYSRASKPVMVHHIVAQLTHALAGTTRPIFDEASHLCGHTVCKTPGHVVYETKTKNQNRKGCQVWMECNHDTDCKKLAWICQHEPHCIKAVPGYTEEEFKAKRADLVHERRL